MSRSAGRHYRRAERAARRLDQETKSAGSRPHAHVGSSSRSRPLLSRCRPGLRDRRVFTPRVTAMPSHRPITATQCPCAYRPSGAVLLHASICGLYAAPRSPARAPAAGRQPPGADHYLEAPAQARALPGDRPSRPGRRPFTPSIRLWRPRARRTRHAAPGPVEVLLLHRDAHNTSSPIAAALRRDTADVSR